MSENEEPIIDIKQIEWDGTLTKIHPALDFQKNSAFVSQFLPYRIGDSVRDVCTLITSSREAFPITSPLTDIQLTHHPQKIAARWSMPALKRFLDGKDTTDTLDKLHEDTKKLMRKYLEMPEEIYYDIMALWTIGTYFFPLFNSYPYIFLNAPKRSGKTKLLTFVDCLAFNGKLLMDLTSSAFFRLVQDNRCTLLIDEIENINSKEMANLRQLLLGGYKRGLFVPRAAEKKKGDVKTYQIEEFDIFAPKMLANIRGMEDVLEDRCITITLARSNSPAILNRAIDMFASEFLDLRDRYYYLMMTKYADVKDAFSVINTELLLLNNKVSDVNDVIGVSGVSVVSDSLLDFQKTDKHFYLANNGFSYTNDTKMSEISVALQKVEDDRVRIDTIKDETDKDSPKADPSIGIIQAEDYNKRLIIKLERRAEFSQNMTSETLTTLNSKVSGRYLELWLPLITLASTISRDLVDSLVRFAVDNCSKKEEQDITENSDMTLLSIILEYAGEERWYSVQEITRVFREHFVEEIDTSTDRTRKKYPDWINERWVGKAIRRLNVVTKYRRLASRREMWLIPSKVAEQASRYGVFKAEKPAEEAHDLSELHPIEMPEIEGPTHLSDDVHGSEYDPQNI